MANRLEPLNVISFTGGLNLRRSEFQLAEDESPDLLNVDIDPRGGFYTRRGWQRWNSEDIVDTTTDPWAPRNAYLHTWANSNQIVYVVNDGVVYSASSTGTFAALTGPEAEATPHGADFATWGDYVYIACGHQKATYRRLREDAPVAMTPETWSEVDSPLPGTTPRAEFIETHAGYLFVAGTFEAGVSRPARIRWSHPTKPDAWRTDDFIDIEANGGKITGIMSFEDHLLIFKSNGMWALYGYNSDSWQLVKVSTSIGCPTVTATTRSETTAFFYSASDRGGIYAYSGDSPVFISERVSTAFEQVYNHDSVFVSWAGRRLWVGVPWTKAVGTTVEPSSVFVFDIDIGETGAWTMYRSDYASVGTVLDGFTASARRPLAVLWGLSPTTAFLDYIQDGYDLVLGTPALGTDTGATLGTNLGFDIAVTGVQGFESYYCTRWLHAGWPDRKKSWRRPTFICRQPGRETELIVEAYRDYDESDIHRSRTLVLKPGGAAFWTPEGFTGDHDEGGFDWTRGGNADPSGMGQDWATETSGSHLIRGGSLGMARAVQLRVRLSPATPQRRWGVDGIVCKYIMRRFR